MATIGFDDQSLARATSLRQWITAKSSRIWWKVCHVAFLRFARNQRCSIKSLPVELLRMIFQSLCDMDPSAGLVVCEVCTYWRSVALNDHWLWRVIDFTAMARETAAKFISRSGELPLTLLLDEETRLEDCRNAIRRTTVLHMKYPDTYCNTVDMQSPFYLPWPEVEELVLSASDPPPHSTVTSLTMEIRFPKLKSLEMSRNYLATGSVLSNLQTFRITDDIPRANKLLSLLPLCPRLEVFEFSSPTIPILPRQSTFFGVDIVFDFIFFLSKQHIAIPTLRRMICLLPATLIIALLDYIEISPEIEHLDFVAYQTWPWAKDLFGPRCLPNSTFSNLDELRLSTVLQPRTRADNCALFSHIVYDSSSRSYQIEVGTENPCDVGIQEMEQLFGTVVQTLEERQLVSSIRKLRINNAGQDGRACQVLDFGRLVQHTQHLELLEIRHHRIQDLYRSFEAWRPSQLPQLRAVVLETTCETEKEFLECLLPAIACLSANPVEMLELELTCLGIPSLERAKSLFTMLKDACAAIPEVYSARTAVTFTTGLSESEFRDYHPQDLWPEGEPLTWKGGKIPA